MVQAHPLETSYNAALLDAVIARLEMVGQIHRVRRLGAGDALSDEDVSGIDELIVVYPTWWGSLPAMLLGPFVQLIEPWVDGDEPLETNPLRSVQRLHAITTHGGPRYTNVLQGEPGRVLWSRTVRRLCAPGATFTWRALYGLDRLEPSALRAFVDLVGQPADQRQDWRARAMRSFDTVADAVTSRRR